jgi:N-acetylmuramoyl-L-alanine amidase
MKRLLPIIKLLLLAVFINAVNVQNVFCQIKAEKLTVVSEGDVLGGKTAVYKYKGDSYFSVKDLSKIYGARLEWHQITGKVSLFMNNKKADFFIKSTKVLIDNRVKHTKLPNHFFNGMVYVPADFIVSGDFAYFSETESNFNSSTNILTLEKKLNISPPRFYTGEYSTKIEIEMNDKLPCQVNDKNKGRVEVSFLRAKIDKEKIDVNDGIVDEIEVREKGRQALVTIYLTAQAGRVNSRFLEDPYRVEIEVKRSLLAKEPPEEKVPAFVCPVPMPETVAASSVTVHVATSAPVAVTGLAAPKKEAVKEEPKKEKKKVILVLDAGHGGEDPGAVGQNGTEEKNINLAIVKELKYLFDKYEADTYEIVTTRYDNTFIPLVERTKLANDKRADLFVAIHCNASMQKKTRGFEIYFLSEKASDKEAAATAILENSALQFEGKPTKNSEKLKELLWSMSVNEFINESSELCCFISQDMGKRTKIENRGVKQANFKVLRGTQMPAVLVECAYLSNLQEEALLKTRKFQRKVADAVYSGIKQYEQRRELLSAKK